MSGFTGSSGTLVITLKEVGLWTDGRYYVQAEAQLKGTGIELFKGSEPETPTYKQWIYDNLSENATVAFDGKVVSFSDYKEMKEKYDIVAVRQII